MLIYTQCLGSKGEILMKDCFDYPEGHASETDLQRFVLYKFQEQDLSDRCRLAVKSIAIFSLVTTLKL